MSATDILVILALISMFAFACFALLSKRATEQRMADDTAPKSTLAADAPSDGKPADV